MVCTNSRAQYEDYELWLKATHDKMRAIITRITPVLDLIDGNPTQPLMGDLDISPCPPDPFVERCRAALANFRTYVHSVACTTARHALVVVRSQYPAVSLEVIDGGFAKGPEDDEVEQLTE